MTFQDAAVKSAQLYYKYLEENDGSLIIYQVTKIIHVENSYKKNQYWLKLDRKPKDTDSLLIRIHNVVCSTEQIKPIIYDNHEHSLKVSLSSRYIGIFNQIQAKDITVISDMKFLVQRVEAWYKNFGSNIALPCSTQNIKVADCSMLSKKLSADQTIALRESLSEPFAYVWGAPGTGKTQFVLARAVLSYIQSGKKILVTAPTNNAVEQTLYGILPVLAEAGLDYNTLVIRLGAPSTDFLAKFPGVCEDIDYSKAISEINDSLSELHLSMEETIEEEKLFAEYVAFQHRLNSFIEMTASLKSLKSQFSEAVTNLSAAQSSIDEILSAITENETAQEECNSSCKFYNRQAQNLLKRSHNPLYAALTWFSREKELNKVDALLEKARFYEEKLVRLQSELDELYEEKGHRQAILTEVESALDKLIVKAVQISKPFKEISAIAKTICPDNISSALQALNDTCECTLTSYYVEKQKYASVESRDGASFEEERNQIRQQIMLHEQRKTALEQTSSGKRIDKCLVIACTIDLCLNRFPVSEENYYSHVFLDEAGYSSLIKAVTLTAYGDKLTFLGDHMQLPPVCEASDQKIKSDSSHLLALWAQSALFTETVFSETPEKICKDYLDKAPAPFQIMKKYSLVNTYRFGETLAQVLADDVYDHSFRGNDGQNTTIYYIDAPKLLESEPRISRSECNAIEQFLSKYPDLRNSTGIISPYKKQVALLWKMAGKYNFPFDSVITVHRSQGREWDNVFLSVTDTSDKFFTDSLNMASDGKKVINTAVSRAKKNLVLVCDYEYWIGQKNQLVGKLLTAAKELKLKDNAE